MACDGGQRPAGGASCWPPAPTRTPPRERRNRADAGRAGRQRSGRHGTACQGRRGQRPRRHPRADRADVGDRQQAPRGDAHPAGARRRHPRSDPRRRTLRLQHGRQPVGRAALAADTPLEEVDARRQHADACLPPARATSNRRGMLVAKGANVNDTRGGRQHRADRGRPQRPRHAGGVPARAGRRRQSGAARLYRAARRRAARDASRPRRRRTTIPARASRSSSALLAHGADPNARVMKGTPVRRWSHDFALLERWIGATPFWLAARFLEIDMMRALAAAGADIQPDRARRDHAAHGRGRHWLQPRQRHRSLHQGSARFLVVQRRVVRRRHANSCRRGAARRSMRCGRSSSWARTSIVRTPPATPPCTPPPRSG